MSPGPVTVLAAFSWGQLCSHVDCMVLMPCLVLIAGFAVGQPTPLFWISEVPESPPGWDQDDFVSGTAILVCIVCLFLRGSYTHLECTHLMCASWLENHMAGCPLVCSRDRSGLSQNSTCFLAVSDAPLVIPVISDVSSPNQCHGIPRTI